LTHTLIIRGFDDQVHEQLGEIANQRGVSINSIVKDAVDKWLKKQESEVPRKHHLLIYSDDESVMRMLKSMDKLAKEGNLFKCFFGPPHSPPIEFLSKLDWYNGTVEPYYYSTPKSKEGPQLQTRTQTQAQTQSQKSIMKYCDKVIQNVAKNADNKQICCMDFLMNDVKKASLREALTIEKVYDNNRIAGLMFCAYKTDNLLNSEIKDLIELFEIHDQIFILKEDEVYKLHITKENVHKLFLS
jgi:ribosomal protein L22